jgi:outer membrane protein TolC
MLNAIEAKFAVGTQSQADYLTTQVEQQRILENRRDFEAKLSDEQTKLKVLMNQDPFSPLSRLVWNDLLTYDLSPERLRRLILANRPEICQAQSIVVEASQKIQLAKRDWIPDPAVTLQADHYNSGSQIVRKLTKGCSLVFPGLMERNIEPVSGRRRAIL